MTNLPAIRVLMILVLVFLLGCVSVGASAQLIPFAPNFPTDAKQCQSFSKDVQAYEADYTEQHEKCLASTKADRQDETHDALVCSRSSCQYLHDRIYGNSILSAKSLQKEVSACYERVREYQADEARKAKEKADQEAREKKDEADEAARGKLARDTRDAQDKKRAADRAAQEKADHLASEAEAKADADRFTALQDQARQTPSATPPRQTTQPNPRAVQKADPSPALVDPFKDSEASKSQKQETASNLSMVDPFATADKLVDPFPHSGRTPEETWDGAKEIFQGFVDKGADNLGDMLKSARKELSPQDYKRFEHTVGDAHSFLSGFSKTLTVVQYGADIKKIYENPKDTDSYHDIISDGASHGFSYVLKRMSPDFLSKIWEGPIGWGLAITFDSSSTQTAKQDFDPVNALNNPGQFSFQQRETALQSLYQSAQKHPEIWNQSRYQWLYGVSEKLYNSPDNPNIHLAPP